MPKKPTLDTESLARIVETTLDDMKALEIKRIDVRHLTSITDEMIIASGRSDRHVRAISDAVLEQAKSAGYTPLGIEGMDSGEWVLIDLADVIVHVMLPKTREFYDIEKLWDISSPREKAEMDGIAKQS